MMPTIRCKCGWSSQVSEYYLGDRVGCPECGVKIDVRENSGVPYAYAPYPTWRKLPKAPRPRKKDYQPTYDPNAGPAFWLGLASLVLVFVGFGFLPGVLLAMFAIRSGVESKRYCRAHGIPRPLRAKAGFNMGVSAILIGLVAVIATVFMQVCPTQCNSRNVECTVIQPQPQNQYRYCEGGAHRVNEDVERQRFIQEHIREEQRKLEMVRQANKTDWRYQESK